MKKKKEITTVSHNSNFKLIVARTGVEPVWEFLPEGF